MGVDNNSKKQFFLRFLFHSTTSSQITTLDQLQDGHSYIASSSAKLKRILYDPVNPEGGRTSKPEKKSHLTDNNRLKPVAGDKFPPDVDGRLIKVVRNTAGGSHKCCSVLLNKRTAQTYNQVGVPQSPPALYLFDENTTFLNISQSFTVFCVFTNHV